MLNFESRQVAAYLSIGGIISEKDIFDLEYLKSKI